MKRIILLSIIIFALGKVAFSQADSSLKKQTVHGVVKNEKNKPVQNPSVVVEGEQAGVVTDSLGFFKIEAKPNAVLIINGEGYDPLLKEVNSRELMQAVLIKSQTQETKPGSPNIIKQQDLAYSFKEYTQSSSGGWYQGASLPVMHQKDDTKGSRYLFTDWATGTVVSDKGKIMSDEYCWFNYDKIAHALLITGDKKSMIQVENSDIRSFTLKDQDTSTNLKKSFDR
jgi:hypothetical protein